MEHIKNFFEDTLSFKLDPSLYIVQRYLGKFFQEKLSTHQVTIDLRNSTATLTNVTFNLKNVNENIEGLNLPLEVVDVYTDKIKLTLPWLPIWKTDTLIEATGAKIIVHPKYRPETGTSMFESIWSAMTTSVEELANGVYSNSNPEATGPGHPTNMSSPSCDQANEGVNNIANALDFVKRRMIVKLVDTSVRFEYIPIGSSTGVGIEVTIGLIEYRNGSKTTQPSADQSSKEKYMFHTMDMMIVNVQNITFSTVEFSSSPDRTLSEKSNEDGSMPNEDGSMPNDDGSMPNEDGSMPNEDGSMPNDDEHSDVNSGLNDLKGCDKDLTETRHVIKFASLLNSFQIKIGLKHTLQAVGPNIIVDTDLKDLALFLSPRQVHILLEIVNAFLNGEDLSIRDSKSRYEAQPMSNSDFLKVEKLLRAPLEPRKLYGIEGIHKWSTAGPDGSDTEDEYQPIKSTMSTMYESAVSEFSESMNSSMSSIFSYSTEYSQASRRKSFSNEQDSSVEVSHITVNFDVFAVILLHEDLLVPTADDNKILVLSSVEQMQQVSENFFDQFKDFVTSNDATEDFINFKENINSKCDRNCTRLLATGVEFQGRQKNVASASSMDADLGASNLDLFEYLVVDRELQAIPLLQFHKSPFSIVQKKPFEVHFRKVNRTKRRSQKNNGPKTNISVSLGKCEVDFDISIIDRLSALMNPPDFFIDESLDNSFAAGKGHPTLDSITTEESRIDLKVTCLHLILKLRFPIPDFRNENIRTPWWKKNVRQDYLMLDCLDLELKSSFQPNQAFQEYNGHSKELNIYYVESDNAIMEHIISTQADEKASASMEDLSLETRFNIKIFPTKSNDLEDCLEPESEPMASSCRGLFEEQTNPDPGPFGSRKKVHQSDIPLSKLKGGKKVTQDSGELLLPGEKHEIENFMKSAIASSKFQIEIVLPIVTAQLTSKHSFEKLYNRINNDLLLWTPSAPKPRANLYRTGYSNYNYGNKGLTAMKGAFDTFTSGLGFNNDSDSDSGDESTDLYYSSIDSRKKLKSRDSSMKGQSNLSLNLSFHRGLVCMNPPARDSTGNVIPGQQGEIVLNLGNTTIFFVSCYKGDEDLSYFTVVGCGAQLYHCDMQPVPRVSPSLRRFDKCIPKHLLPTIYKSQPGMLDNSSKRNENRDMVTVAMKIKDNQSLVHKGLIKEDGKEIQISLGLNKSTLRYRMIQEPNSWFSQLLDFFTLADYPILNYWAKDVLTEMHLHLWNCAIDYRPLHLPIRTALTMDNFSITTNVSSLTSSSTASFTLEEIALLFSERSPPIDGKASSAPINLKRDYFHVVGLGCLDFSLKINEKATSENPRLDLRISNNILRFNTCADSAKMLLEFLTYISSEGDLTYDLEDDSPFPSPKLNKGQDQQLINIDSKIPVRSNITTNDQERLKMDLFEAMQEETVKDEKQESSVPASSHDSMNFFYFPDEQPSSSQCNGRLYRRTSESNVHPLVAQDLGDTTRYPFRDITEEFEMIDNEPGLYPKDGIPEIKWLSNDPVRIVEDHFNPPSDKVDVLKAPSSFPHAVVRYTLRDMSISWNIYGGNDFESITKDNKSKTKKKKKKTVNFADRTGHKASPTKSSDTEIHLGCQKKAVPWLKKGGINRRHDINVELLLVGIRFQYEIYPETTIHASRQVLSISDYCIKDKLESSRINKFLYHDVNELRPKQTRAHMIVIKAIYIRPDTRINRQELSLVVSMLPLRFNIDQDTARFLIQFFSELGSGSLNDNEEDNYSQQSTPTHPPPVLTIPREGDNTPKITNENLIMFNSIQQDDLESTCSSVPSSLPDNSPIYVRNFVFSPAVPIKIDFSGKVSFNYGLSEFLMGLAELNSVELTLKRLSCRDGLVGIDKVIEYAVQEFSNDIKKRQFPNLFKGVGPINSLVKLCQGLTGLIMMPVEQYRKDGRILRGIQRGASNFKVSVVLASLDLLGRLVGLIQSFAEVTYDMLSPGPSLSYIAKQKSKKNKKRYREAQDIREGFTNAVVTVRDGFGETAKNIVLVAAHEKEQKGLSGAVGGVLREIPATMVRPLIVVTGATHDIIGGVRNQLVPDARREANEKWRTDFNE
ncbi:autophagy-related 2 isoform X2 [Leptinotarsa decemlineata]|uniref:autophagy-related 2 isoform X2 n=1 Tax=Leptinotarsa decemlineata TaxID=7539 RepID=UPI003D305625